MFLLHLATHGLIIYGPATQGLINLYFIDIPSAAPLTIRNLLSDVKTTMLQRLCGSAFQYILFIIMALTIMIIPERVN